MGYSPGGCKELDTVEHTQYLCIKLSWDLIEIIVLFYQACATILQLLLSDDPVLQGTDLKKWFLNIIMNHNHLEGLGTLWVPCPISRVSDSVGLRSSLRIDSSNKFPGDGSSNHDDHGLPSPWAKFSLPENYNKPCPSLCHIREYDSLTEGQKKKCFLTTRCKHLWGI